MNCAADGSVLHDGQMVRMRDGTPAIIIDANPAQGECWIVTGGVMEAIINEAKLTYGILRLCLGNEPWKKAIEQAAWEYKEAMKRAKH